MRRCAYLSRDLWPPGSLRVPPLDAVDHVGQLSAGDRHASIRRRGPDEAAASKAFGVKRHAEPIVPDDLDQVAAAAPEHVEIAGMGIAAEASAAPAAPSRSCRAACLCGPLPARPGPQKGPGSSAQHRRHATQSRGADRLGHPQRGAIRQHDLDPVTTLDIWIGGSRRCGRTCGQRR